MQSVPITSNVVSSNPALRFSSDSFYMKLYLCMNEFAFMYDYVYMSLCFILMSMHACFVFLLCDVM